MAPISLEIYVAVLVGGLFIVVAFLFSRRAAAKAEEEYQAQHTMNLAYTQQVLAQQAQDLTTATYDGRDLKFNGEVLRIGDKRRELVTHILVLPGVTAIHGGVSWYEGAFYNCTSLSSITLPEGLRD